MAVDEERPPILRLYIDTDHPLSAHRFARIIDRLDVGYGTYIARRRRGPSGTRLRIQQLRTGSVLTDLVAAADASLDLYEHRELLGGFVAQLADALNWLAGMSSLRRGNSSDRSTVEALAAPVAYDHARQVSLQVVGDNNTVLIVTPDLAQMVMGARQAENLLHKTPTLEESFPEPEVANSIRSVVREAKRPEGRRRLSPPHLGQTTYSIGSGTLRALDGRWYVCLAGSEALIPVIEDSEGSFGSEADHSVVTGRILYEEGLPKRFRVLDVVSVAKQRGKRRRPQQKGARG